MKKKPTDRRPHRNPAFLSVVFLTLLSSCASPDTVPSPTLESTNRPIQTESFHDLQEVFKEITLAEPVQEQALADGLFQTLAGNQKTPWTSSTQVVFFYKGQADQVDWRGSFNNWSEPGLAGARVGQTDLWIAYTELPEASRAEYKIILDNTDWVVDSANPDTTYNGMAGISNVVALPGFRSAGCVRQDR